MRRIQIQTMLFCALLLLDATRAEAGGLPCLHWHTLKPDLINSGQPPDQRGWTVECLYYADQKPGHWAHEALKKHLSAARAQGIEVLLRIDYQGGLAVPTDPAAYKAWSDDFIARAKDFAALTPYLIVGNEPPLEGKISAQQYAAAFNHLYGRKAELPAGTRLLAVGPNFHCCAWVNGLDWLEQMASALDGVDGFALHTYHDPGECGPSPDQPCEKVASWPGDDGFRNYRDQIDRTRKKWPDRPIYITEVNTDTNGIGLPPDAKDNYPAGWFQKAFAEVQAYNQATAADPTYPQVLSLCWFVDRDEGPWAPTALDAQQGKLAQARADFVKVVADPASYVIPAKAVTADAGSPDAGSADVGSPDAGSPDAGSPDAGSPDAGSPVAGPPVDQRVSEAVPRIDGALDAAPTSADATIAPDDRLEGACGTTGRSDRASVLLLAAALTIMLVRRRSARTTRR